MAFKSISAAEAASLVKHGYNIGLSGFTPAGTAKAVTSEIAKIAEAEHAKGNPFQIGIFTGASTGDSCDGILSRVKAENSCFNFVLEFRTHSSCFNTRLKGVDKNIFVEDSECAGDYTDSLVNSAIACPL